MKFKKPEDVNYFMIQENIRGGERILRYRVEAKVNGRWVNVGAGESVGHKRIQPFERVKASALRLIVDEARDLPDIINFSAFNVL